MKIFLLKLNLESKQVVKSQFYYSILGSILNLFKNDENIYNSILSISPLIKNKENSFLIKLTIFGEKNFNLVINKLLENKKEISLDGTKFKLTSLDFNFSFIDLNNIEYKDFSQINIDFKSPTLVKKKQKEKIINYYLPEPKIFITSAIRRYLNIISQEVKENKLDLIKDKIEKNFFIVEFDIHTKKVQIKNGIKAGVVGKIKYELNKNNSLEKKELILINNALKLANYIGLGNSTKLGLGQVRVRLI